MRFTPEERAATALFDAEIEATFQLTAEEGAHGRRLDREAVLDGMGNQKRKIAERKRQYYEANKEKMAEYQRQYREAHKGEIAECNRQYYEDHKEGCLNYRRQYYEANKEKIADYQRQYRETQKEKRREPT